MVIELISQILMLSVLALVLLAWKFRGTKRCISCFFWALALILARAVIDPDWFDRLISATIVFLIALDFYLKRTLSI